MPTKGYSHIQAAGITNCSGKVYIDSSRLHFSDEGIFLSTQQGKLGKISHISHDSSGYYLTPLSPKEEPGNSNEKEEETWACPNCGNISSKDIHACEVCDWPFGINIWIF